MQMRPLIVLALLLAESLCFRASLAEASTEDELGIVINSVHSGQLASKRLIKRPFGSPIRLANTTNAITPSSQPSQEFEAQTMAPRSSQNYSPFGPSSSSSNSSVRWQSKQQPSSSFKSKPTQAIIRDQLNLGASAPYATGPAAAFAEPAQRMQPANLLLIRDTSELQSQNETSQPISSADHKEQQQQQQLMWMQSVRDNHHGPLRSRFDLSQSSGQQAFSQRSGDDRILFDGHMKVKLAPTISQSPYEQQKSLRTSPPGEQLIGEPTSGQGLVTSGEGIYNSSRRNSKFTRQTVAETTTPLSSEKLISTPSKEKTSTSTSASKTTTTTTTTPAISEEPATGNGHVIVLNETDLLILGQKFEIDTVALAQQREQTSHNKSSLPGTQVTNEQERIWLGQKMALDGANKTQKSSEHLANSSAAKTTLPSGASLLQDGQQQTIMLSNNHSLGSKRDSSKKVSQVVGKRMRTKQQHKRARGLFSSNGAVDIDEEPASGQVERDDWLESRQMQPQEAKVARTWSRLLPNLLQRTISGVFRRLAGAGQQQSSQMQQQRDRIPSGVLQQQQQQQYGQSNDLTTISQSGGFNFLASALSAAATAAASAPPPPIKPATMDNQMLPTGNHQLASASSVHELRQPLRQHANKKIIDSFIDLPASERTAQDIEPRQGDEQSAHLEEPRRGKLEANDQETLKAEPRSGSGSSPLDSLLSIGKNIKLSKSNRRSKTTSDWKRKVDQLGDSVAAAEDDDGAEVLLQNDDYNYGQQVESEANVGKRSMRLRAEPAEEVEDTEELGAGGGKMDSNADYANEDGDLLESADSLLIVDRVPGPESSEPALGQVEQDNEAASGNLEDDNLEQDSNSKQEEEEEGGEDEQLGESSEQIFFYSPQSNFKLSATRLRGIDEQPAGSGRGHSLTLKKVNSIRRPEITPIEPTAYKDPIQTNLMASAKPIRRKSPQIGAHSTNANRGKRPGQEDEAGNSHNVVAPIHLGEVEPYRRQVSRPKKPASIFEAPIVSDDEREPASAAAGGSNQRLMSPMSSSINVMDLDPSMTRLAHNKLIVAKFKPKRSKTKQPAKSSGRTPSPGSSANSSQPNSGSPSKATTKSPNLISSTSKPRQSEDLAASILGGQMPSSDHINNIISRWTRPAQSASRKNEVPERVDTASSPASLAAAATTTAFESSTSEPAQELSSPSRAAAGQKPVLAPTLNRSQGSLISDLQSLVPSIASSLAARLSAFPTSRTSASSTPIASSTTTTTTSTTSAPKRELGPSDYSATSAQHLQPADGNASPAIPANNSSPLSLAALGSNYANVVKNDKFKFSLLSMNNRERINPLLYPVENQRQFNSSSLSNNRRQHTNPRNRTTTTTTTTTTSTTSTTQRPSVTLQANTNHSKPVELTAALGSSAKPTNGNLGAIRQPDQQQQQQQEGIGQTLRNQHRNKPAKARPHYRPLSQSERLRNQYLAMIGKNASLDARINGFNLINTDLHLPVEAADAHLSGHITLVTNANQQQAEDRNATLGPLEKAAQEANRYLTLGGNNEPALDSSANEASIVIMSDNHHQTTRSSGARPAPLQSVGSAALNSAQIARKFLEEFVNGTRIRPSSVTIKPSALLNNDHYRLQAAENVAQSASTTTARPAEIANDTNTKSLLTLTNHHSRPQSAGGVGAQSRNGTVSLAAPNRKLQSVMASNYNLAFNRPANGAPAPEASGLVAGKLDDRAQELLLDIFDRDPSYSSSFYSVSSNRNEPNQKLPEANKTHLLAGNDSEDDGLAHYTLAESLSSKPATSQQFSLSTETVSEQPGEETTATMSPASTPASISSTTKARSSEFGLGLELDQASKDLAPAPVDALISARGDLDSGESADLNNRVSMRKSQAKIQSLLESFAKRQKLNSNNTQSQSADSDEPQTGANQEQSAPASQELQPGEQSGGSTLSAPTHSSDADSSSDEPSLETTQFYAPQLRSTTLAALQTASSPAPAMPSLPRYPNVEIVSSSRQKINRPSADSLSPALANQLAYEQLSAMRSSLGSTSTTQAMQANPNRATEPPYASDTFSSLRPGEYAPPNRRPAQDDGDEEPPSSSGAGEQPMDGNLTPNSGHSEEVNKLVRRPGNGRPKPAHERERDRDRDEPGNDLNPGNYPEFVAYQQRPVRPVIIRRRPRPPTGTRRPQRPINGGSNASQKRKRKPSKRPSEYSGDQANEESNIGQEDSVTINGQLDANEEQQFNSILVRRPNKPQNSVGIIRKRPSGGYNHRLPPGNIRITSSAQSSSNNEGGSPRKPAGPISIVLPVIKRKDQDIRTRPLTIIEPAATAAPNTNSIDEAVLNPTTLTRIPETTIMHNKVVVAYRPGRPLPGSNSGFGSIGAGQSVSPDNDSPATTEQYPADTSISTASGPELTGGDESPTNNGSLIGRPPQLGSGNNGDTLLVSIEQQQAQLRPTRRPPPTSAEPPPMPSSVSVATGAPSPTEPSTPPSGPPPTPYPPHRPIIVINGLFGNPGQSNSSQGEPGGHQHQHHHRPYKPNSNQHQNQLVEAGSMSVVAQASHGQQQHPSGNSSRPWYPTSSFSSVNSNGRHNSTSNSTTNSSGPNDSGSSNSADLSSSSSSQTADSVIPADLPNFGGSSGFSPSGSYQNHHHHQNQHIGMPYLPGPGHGTLAKPGQRPNRWRVRRRPSGNANPNGSNSTPSYDFLSAPSASSIVYRPISGSLGQVLSLSTLTTMFDNVTIFFARIRTFLISLMVMFLPPLALAASVVNAMSS